jgi:1,4-dihydroxy-2-naphthoate octaprenyltransferase
VATVSSATAPGAARAFVLAARPRTLPAAVAPVCVGTALAAANGSLRPLAALAALAVALLLQVAANFANDLFDFERGADTEARVGPARAVASGWITPARMRVAVLAALVAAAVPGLHLVALGGWPIAAAGVLSIAAALAYTGGPLPFGYLGLGELGVFAFFGVVAVCGTYFVQAGSLAPAVFVASLAVGALASAILVVNNLRDVDTDRAAGKRTLAVRFGRRAARAEYAGLLASAYTVPIALVASGAASPAALAPFVTLPWALLLTIDVARARDAELNPLLGATAKLELVFCALFALGLAA